MNGARTQKVCASLFFPPDITRYSYELMAAVLLYHLALVVLQVRNSALGSAVMSARFADINVTSCCVLLYYCDIIAFVFVFF